jgi:16S rRNA C1402 (ribose-2'-O) methylase RsmI
MLVGAAVGRGIGVSVVCGASAVTAALSISGFAFGAFAFYGFLPRTIRGLKQMIYKLTDCGGPEVSVFFESPKRIKKTLKIFADIIPESMICLCNDLTKKYERIYRGAPQKILEELVSNPSAEKGEYTMVVCFAGSRVNADCFSETKTPEMEKSYGAVKTPILLKTPVSVKTYGAAKTPILSKTPESVLADYLVENGGTVKEAINNLSGEKNYTKKALYAASLNLRKIFNSQ